MVAKHGLTLTGLVLHATRLYTRDRGEARPGRYYHATTASTPTGRIPYAIQFERFAGPDHQSRILA